MKNNSILALFPPGNRQDILRLVLKGDKVYEKYMLYGIDKLIQNGISVETNLNINEVSFYSRLLNSIYHVISKNLIGSHGELSWITPVFKLRNKYKIIFSFSEKCIYPVLFARRIGLLQDKKIILISIGLSEKICLLKKRGKHHALKRLLGEISQISKILTFSWYEQFFLSEEYHLNNIEFLPLGVDFEIFKSDSNIVHLFDVVSVGADKNRDFQLLLDVARNMEDKRFLIITNKYHSKILVNSNLPKNIEMKVDIPMGEVCKLIDSSKLVFLPVKENLYSGATTCLLQSMSLSKAVVTSNVAPIRNGYGLLNKENVIFYNPGNSKMALNEISTLLNNSNYMNKIGNNARQHVKNFLSLEKMVTSINQIIMSEF